MDITKSTLWGALALVMLAVVIFAYRGHLLAERAKCGKQLQHVAVRLDAYAATHHGDLPTDFTALRQAIGPVPASTIEGESYVMESRPLKWKQGAARPYLWDPRPHLKINGIHVLATDGNVYLVNNMNEVGNAASRVDARR